MSTSVSDFFESAKYQMADISGKRPTFRRAIAMGCIHVGPVGFKHIIEQTLPKGDVLKLAEVAGIQGAKTAWQNIPMCHPISLDHVAVLLEPEEKSHSIMAYAVASVTSKTGVEMEALAAVNAALLTIYDLTKPVEPALWISDIRLAMKEGGKKGLWIHPNGFPEKLNGLLPITPELPLQGLTAATITLSDRASKGEYEDKSGAILQDGLKTLGATMENGFLLSDDPDQLTDQVMALCGKVDVIVTTGGTGLSPRDITPQTLAKLGEYEIPGIGELLRSASSGHVPTSWLSRTLAIVREGTLIIALPGSTGAVKDGIESLKTILMHAVRHLKDEKNIHCSK